LKHLTKMNNNETLEQALVLAITDAFFNQKQYYSNDGQYRTYGGQCVDLVKKQLERTDFQVTVGNAFEQFKKLSATAGEQAIKDYWSSYEQNIKSKAANIAQKYLEDHQGIEALVKEKIDGLITDKKISIQVIVTVTGH